MISYWDSRETRRPSLSGPPFLMRKPYFERVEIDKVIRTTLTKISQKRTTRMLKSCERCSKKVWTLPTSNPRFSPMLPKRPRAWTLQSLKNLTSNFWSNLRGFSITNTELFSILKAISGEINQKQGLHEGSDTHGLQECLPMPTRDTVTYVDTLHSRVLRNAWKQHPDPVDSKPHGYSRKQEGRPRSS